MRDLYAMGRRIVDLERRLENQHRQGDVTDVKFDDEKKRWYVKMQDGEGEEAFKSDWLPWQSFAHGSIKVSMPPRKGQKVVMHSPNGDSEMAYAKPYHYGPDAKSPHDKQDEVVLELEEPEQQQQGDQQQGIQQQSSDGQQQRKKWRAHIKNDSITFTSGEMTFTASMNEILAKIGETQVSVKEDGVRAKSGDAVAIVKKTKGAKIAYGTKFVAAGQSGLVSSEPITQGADPVGD